ncbi:MULTISPECIES: gp53-like domain-containing protein [Xenorhabdus]|uniref:gp53-like domain-containing protein n=1 Tax=Xenorhabdus TaxID=626 RepID=UPI00064A2AB3|nr:MULTISPECIES: hypothetical protein [Xenorhabdus]KLU16590.1 hypothetical protein AAY47_04990 [Xenorhabdus griffiniae]KOP32613.1 hypothetical protein AFK69_14410 [Xenorhabdus sp. GDc328]
MRGSGVTHIDTFGGCDVREGLRVGKQVVPDDYGNFDSRYLSKNDGGELLSPVRFSGFRKNTGSIAVSTHSDGNNFGDGQTQFGYNKGSQSRPEFHHYLRGRGVTAIDTLGGCDISAELRVGRQVVPRDYGNFDSRYLRLTQIGDATGNVPSMAYFLASLGYNGWQQFPSQDGAGNLIIQWGAFGEFKSGESVQVQFTRPFPRYCVFAVPVAVVPYSTNTTTVEPVYLAEKTNTHATFRKGGTETLNGIYIALGY